MQEEQIQQAPSGLIGYSNIFGMIDMREEQNRLVAGTGRHANPRVGITDWIPHPAFTFGERELPGIWVGKYMTGTTVAGAAAGTHNNTNVSTARIQPNTNIWRSITASNMFDAFIFVHISIFG